MKVTSDERRVPNEEGKSERPLRDIWARPGELPGGGPDSEPVSLLAAVLFFVGLAAAAGAMVMAGVFFWPWLVDGARWVGWVVGRHPGIVMLVLIVVAVGALRLSRWMDERGE